MSRNFCSGFELSQKIRRAQSGSLTRNFLVQALSDSCAVQEKMSSELRSLEYGDLSPNEMESLRGAARSLVDKSTALDNRHENIHPKKSSIHELKAYLLDMLALQGEVYSILKKFKK